MAKKHKLRVPKHIGALKIKKKHRKAINGLIDLLESPEVRTTLASLAGVMVGARNKSKDDKPAVR